MIAYTAVNWVLYFAGCCLLIIGHSVAACVSSWGAACCGSVRKRLGIKINLGPTQGAAAQNNIAFGDDD